MEELRDLNMEVAGRLRDMSLVHPAPHGRIAYRRAARAVLALEEPLDALAARRSVREVRFLGPASERIILESLEHGFSPTVERAIEASGRRAEVEAARALRAHFLSRAATRQVLSVPLPGVVAQHDYRGDLQTHSEWSDGADSIAGLAEAARRRGHGYLAVTDHSYGLRIARGMSMRDARRRHALIDRLNRRWAGAFRVLDGIEANIPAEGGVDLAPEELAEFELVLAAPHSKLRREEDQTERMLAAVRCPGVDVLAHPRGRMVSRAGVRARWDEVFEAAHRHGVAVELDGDPFRQDLDHTLARRALEAGCWFALDSDAHSGAELRYADIALAHARLAGIPAARVVNTWPVERLLEWTARRRPRPRERAAPKAAGR